MERLGGDIAWDIPEGCFPLSTDSMVLAAFARLPRNARVLDLGSGCGTLGALLCGRDKSCHVTGVELTENAHLAALENIRRNGLDSRMVSICADLRQISQIVAPGSFSLCLSNPPYFPTNSPGASLTRKEETCSPEDLFRAAAWGLKFGGDLCLVHRPERLGELIARASAYKLEAKELLLLRHRQGEGVSLILLRLRKGGKPGLLLREEALLDSRGTPTEFYHRVYHTQK